MTSQTDSPCRVLFVCLGNICRSASAEAVLSAKATAKAISLDMDSAGTGDWHVGQPPDERAVAAAAARGLDMSAQRARQVCPDDFLRFTHIFAMDTSNLAALNAMRPAGGVQPQLLLNMTPDRQGQDVPDPYYGGRDGFEHMLDLIEAAIDGFLQKLPHEVSAAQEIGGRS